MFYIKSSYCYVYLLDCALFWILMKQFEVSTTVFTKFTKTKIKLIQIAWNKEMIEN